MISHVMLSHMFCPVMMLCDRIPYGQICLKMSHAIILSYNTSCYDVSCYDVSCFDVSCYDVSC